MIFESIESCHPKKFTYNFEITTTTAVYFPYKFSGITVISQRVLNNAQYSTAHPDNSTVQHFFF